MPPDSTATQRDIDRVLVAVARVEDKLDRGYADHEARLRFIEMGRAAEGGADAMEHRSIERIAAERRWRWGLLAGVGGSLLVGVANIALRLVG